MADVKFSELNALSATDVASDDVFAIVDTSATTSKKLTIDSLFGSIPVDAKIADTTDSTTNTSGALIVSGGVGIAKSVTIGENLTVHGDTTISGNLTFGDAASDKVTFTADIGSSLTPSANVTYDIGTDEFFWMNVYSNNITTTAYTQNSTSILMNTTNKMYFHDTGLSVRGAADGTLDIAADTILEITAPTTNVIATTALTIHTPAITANGTVTIGVDGTGHDVIFYTATANKRWWIDEDADTMYANVTSVFGGNITVGVDGTGHDVTFYGDTASSKMLWDQSDDQMEFGNSFITMSDARTSGSTSRTGITVDIYNKYDSGAYDTIGAALSSIGDTNGYTVRDCVAIRATSKNSTGSEVTRLNTPIHAVLDLANTAAANNTGTTLSGAYGMVIDHDDTVATRTGQPTAFISFGEMYVGGTTSIETKYLFDIFPEGKTGDATYGTAADLSFYDDATIIAAERDAVILNSTDGSPGTDAGDLIVLETMDGDAYTPSRILEESHTDTSTESPDQYNYIVMEDVSGDGTTPYIMLDTVGESAGILDTEGGKVIFEDGTQSADGTIKIRINGEDKYIQVYNTY